jgi:hypothetical protein
VSRVNEYALVLWLWVLAILLDLIGIFAHIAHWWYVQPFRHYLLYANVETCQEKTNSIVAAWLRDAVFHLGLRILLALLAGERILLQVTIPLDQRDGFSASAFQIGLAIAFLVILIWLSLWTLRIQAAYRFYHDDVFGMMFRPDSRTQ